MAKKKISDAEAEVIKDAIIDTLETNEDVAAEETAAEEVTPTEDVTEQVLNVPAPEVSYPGHNTRAFRQ